MSDTIITGGCLCGAVRFELTESSISMGTCHCRACQRATGSAFYAGVGFRSSALTWTKGEPTVFKTSEIMERGFCSKCGSTLFLYYTDPPWSFYEKGRIGIAVGALDNPDDYTPEYHYGVETKLHWVATDDGLPQERIDEDAELMAVYVAPTTAAE